LSYDEFKRHIVSMGYYDLKKDKEGLIAFIKNKSTFKDEQKEEILGFIDVLINGVNLFTQIEGNTQKEYIEKITAHMLNSSMFVQTDHNGVSSSVEGSTIAMYSSDSPLDLKRNQNGMQIEGMSDQTWSEDLDSFFPEPLQPFSF
jgi:hypothetical protein